MWIEKKEGIFGIKEGGMRVYTEDELLEMFDQAMRHLAQGPGKPFADIELGSIVDGPVGLPSSSVRPILRNVVTPRPRLKLVSTRSRKPAPKDEPPATDPSA